MAEIIVDGVPAEDLPRVWDQVWPWLVKAIDRFPDIADPFTEEIVARRLLNGTMQLWIAWDNGVIGAVTTEIKTDERHPGKVFCSIPLVAGERFAAWGDPMWEKLKAWGMANGCTHALGYGRAGWKRMFGFVDCGTVDGVPVMIRTLKGKRHG